MSPITRRNTLQIAATLAASRGALFAVTPEEARAALDQSLAGDDFPLWQHGFAPDASPLDDPVAFAIESDSTDIAWGSGFADGAAREFAAYKQALSRVATVAPDVLTMAGGNPLTRLDEEVIAMASASWRAGVVAGAAYEHLRLALTAPLRVCRCNGYGCEACEGRGTVPASRPVLDFGVD